MISIMIIINNNNNNNNKYNNNNDINNNDINNNNNNILLTYIAQILMKHLKKFNCFEKALLFFHRRAKGERELSIGGQTSARREGCSPLL